MRNAVYMTAAFGHRIAYDLTTLLHNLAVAGALCAAFRLGLRAPELWERGRDAWQPNVRGEPAP